MTRRLLLDEMLSPVIAERLREQGVDAVAVASRPDLRGRADAEVLAAAAAERRVLVTRNVADFMRLDAEWSSAGRKHPGIIGISPATHPEDARFVSSVTAALVSWSGSPGKRR